MPYTGKIYRGVDYSPTWPSWTQGGQTNDSDYANDAFASLWAGSYQANAGPSAPVNNGSTYRNDLQTIANDGFDLVRLYNWDMARGTTSSSNNGSDHLNFLNTANTLGLKIVVPVSDFFIGNNPDTWVVNNSVKVPDSTYSFASAPAAVQADFNQFINSIIDPTTNKIHTAIHSIAVGNEADIHTGIGDATASQWLARTNWWIYNLNQQINGTAAASNGTTVMLTATISNADQGIGRGTGTWFNDLLAGVTTTTQTPNGWSPTPGPILNFDANVTGLSVADPSYASYYYNSVNIAQVSGTSPYSASQLSQTLSSYDAQTAPWPYPATKFNVPLMLMEVFNNNRFAFSPTTDQATAYVNQATAIENYLKTNAGTTNLMGYNFFEFNDEPATGNPQMGLYQYTATSQPAQTGTTSTFYGGFGDLTFPVYTLTPTPGPTGSAQGTTLVSAWTSLFPATHQGTAGHDTLVGSAGADRHQGAAGNDRIDGGKGYDTALFGQNAKGYTLKATAGSAVITVQDKTGTDGTDTLTSIENVRFTDLALTTTGLIATASLPTTQVLKVVDLYTAGFGRAPDALGLDYWAGRLADGASLGDISKGIFGSAEAAPIYSLANSNPAFVNLVYATALGRTADAGGLAYWANELQTGNVQRTDFVTTLIAGARGPGGSAADAQYIANREAVGGHFALTQGLTNGDWAKTVLTAVNGNTATVTAANVLTDTFATIAATPATSELVVQVVGLVP